MKQVIQCEGKREVWTIINAYSDSVFRGRIQAYEELAQGPVRSSVDGKNFFFFLPSLKKKGGGE